MAKNASKASILPVLISALAFLTSVGIYFYTRTTAHAFTLHLLGYLLTPLTVALCMGLDSIFQRRGLGNNPWYEKDPQFALILRILTGLSFIPAIFHIIPMASDIAEKFAGQG
jgi:hypothetical protein